jgi:flagellar hook-length control protein FliK
MSATTPQPASIPTQPPDQELPAPQAAIPSLAPCGNSTAVVAASIPEAGAKSAAGGAKLPTSAGADAEHVISNLPSAVATTVRSTSLDPKPTFREAAHSVGTIDPKSASGYSSTSKPQEAIGDELQKTIEPLFPAAPTPSTKPALWPQTQPNQGVARESDGGIVLPSSETLKGDGDAAQNPPPSDTSKSSASAAVLTPKHDFDSAMTQASDTPPSTVAGAAQLSAVVDNKPLAPTASPKASDATPKNLGQASAPAEAEVLAEASGLHIGSPLQVAKLMERAGETELRVGIQAGEFGSVDIRTSMVRGQFSAEISVEQRELGRAMTAELPALHNRFEEQRLPLANIILQDHSHAGGSGDAGQGQRHQQEMQPTRIFGGDDANAATPMVAAETLETGTGLDVHI